jgi:hypothetical protein
LVWTAHVGWSLRRVLDSVENPGLV